MRENKYNAQKSGGFASKREERRFQELRLLERAGVIADLRRQVKYVLIPAQRERGTEIITRGKNKGRYKPGKLIEKECSYYADFVYQNVNTGKLVVEDAKGYRDGQAYALFTIKRKLMLQVYGIRVREV